MSSLTPSTPGRTESRCGNYNSCENSGFIWVHLVIHSSGFAWDSQWCVWGASFEQMPSIVLALQLAEGGELFDFMMYTGFFNEVVARTLFRQLLSALQVRH